MAAERSALAALAGEIDRLRRCREYLLAPEEPCGEACEEAPSLWDLVDRALLWRVFLEGVAEPDLDIEIRQDVIIVRGATAMGDRPHRHALLPMPAPYVARRPRMQFVAGVLEIRIEGPQ